MSVDGESSRPSVPPTPVAEAPDEFAGLDDTAKAEKIKEKGNAAFKAQRYAAALDLYSQAIGTLRRSTRVRGRVLTQRGARRARAERTKLPQ
jgi:hypothetical protein